MGGLLNRKRLRQLEAKIGALTSATVAAPSGSIGTVELEAGVLAASVAGRALVATDFFDAATLLAKIATDGFTEANVDALFAANAIDGADRIKAASIAAASLTDAILDGSKMAVVADANVLGGVPVVHRVLLASGADANVDVTLTEKTRVMDVVVILKGAGTTGSDVQVQNVSTAITDLIDVSAGSDTDVFRPSTIDDAQQEIAAAANLRVAYTSTSADFPGAEVYVTGMKVT